MRPLANSNLSKALVVLAIFMTLGIGVFSMAAMRHIGDNNSCVTSMDHSTDCSAPAESDFCLNFHLGLLRTFSQNFSVGNIGFDVLLLVLSLGFLLFAISNLFADAINIAEIFKVRLRQLLEDTSTVFYDSLGYWLSMFQKRDPAHAFALMQRGFAYN